MLTVMSTASCFWFSWTSNDATLRVGIPAIAIERDDPFQVGVELLPW